MAKNYFILPNNVVDKVIPRIIKECKSRTAALVYLTLWRLTRGWNMESRVLTEDTLTNYVGSDVRTIRRAIRSLKEKGFIEIVPRLEHRTNAYMVIHDENE